MSRAREQIRWHWRPSLNASTMLVAARTRTPAVRTSTRTAGADSCAVFGSSTYTRAPHTASGMATRCLDIGAARSASRTTDNCLMVTSQARSYSACGRSEVNRRREVHLGHIRTRIALVCIRRDRRPDKLGRRTRSDTRARLPASREEIKRKASFIVGASAAFISLVGGHKQIDRFTYNKGKDNRNGR